jgi:hypothetical protein
MCRSHRAHRLSAISEGSQKDWSNDLDPQTNIPRPIVQMPTHHGMCCEVIPEDFNDRGPIVSVKDWVSSADSSG